MNARAAEILASIALYGCGAAATPARAPAEGGDRATDERPVNRLVVGDGHSCAIAPTGRVHCWGTYLEEDSGQNYGDEAERPAGLPPTEVEGIVHAVELRAGSGFACAREAGGAVLCWGNSAWGPTPARVSGIDRAVAIAAGRTQACAIHRGHELACWGPSHEAEGVDLGGPVSLVATGTEAACGRLESGSIRCASLDPGSDELTTILEDGADVEELALYATEDRQLRGCARRRGGSAECFVSTGAGTIRAPVASGSVVSIGVGTNGSCAALPSGAVDCWRGMGDGTATANDGMRTVRLEGVDDAVELAIGNYHNCLRRRDGRVSCWGQNDNGGLGTPPLDRRREAAAVPGITDASHLFTIAAGACAVRAGGRLTCWGIGGDDDEPLSDPTLASPGFEPIGGPCGRQADGHGRCFDGNEFVDLGPIDPGAEVAWSQGNGVCVLPPRGAIRCWWPGAADVPVTQFPRPRDAASIEMQGGNLLVVHQGGTVDCGRPRMGPLGRLPGIVDAVDAVGGDFRACVRLRDGRLSCLDGCTTEENILTFDPHAAEVAFSDFEGYDLYVRRLDGTVAFGRLEHEEPGLEDVQGLPAQVAQIAAGRGFACARMEDGTVRCWGSNESGGLGVRALVHVLRPLDVPGLHL